MVATHTMSVRGLTRSQVARRGEEIALPLVHEDQRKRGARGPAGLEPYLYP